jgi:hypothetical protein
MKAAYHIDSSIISIKQLKSDLLDRELIPSRKPLKENLEKNLLKLERTGITTFEELLAALKIKPKIKELSQLTGISEEYLILLRREVNSYFPNPVLIHKFPGISSETAERLSSLGIKNSKQLFERSAGGNDLPTLVSSSGISLNTLQRLSGMADLVRAYGVGPVFADLLFDAGIRSLEVFLSHTPEEIIDLYQQKVGKKADFSISDLEFSQVLARKLFTE